MNTKEKNKAREMGKVEGADGLKILFIFRERGKEGEREGEKHQCVVAPSRPLLGTWPTTQACALVGN